MTTLATILQTFAFDSQAVRVVHKDGTPWFVAKDVCACLGIVNHRDALAKLDDDEKDGVGISDAIGREQITAIISESGLYTLILRSQGAVTSGTVAHTFRKWVTSEVLPAIRKTGQYSAPGVAQAAGDAQAASDARLDKVIGLVEQLLAALPHMAQSHSGQTQPMRRKKVVRVLYREDINRILALRAKGYVLDELVSESGFSQSQCWAVISGQYKVLESGRASINLKSPVARAADAAVKFERANQQPLI